MLSHRSFVSLDVRGTVTTRKLDLPIEAALISEIKSCLCATEATQQDLEKKENSMRISKSMWDTSAIIIS